MDYYLKANTEAELYNVLENAGVVKASVTKDLDGNVISTGYITNPDFALDVIGKINKPTGNFITVAVGDTTSVIPETIELPGFHANLRGPDTLAERVILKPYEPSEEEKADTSFVMPPPSKEVIPSPIKDILIDAPSTPSRVWL